MVCGRRCRVWLAWSRRGRSSGCVGRWPISAECRGFGSVSAAPDLRRWASALGWRPRPLAARACVRLVAGRRYEGGAQTLRQPPRPSSLGRGRPQMLQGLASPSQGGVRSREPSRWGCLWAPRELSPFAPLPAGGRGDWGGEAGLGAPAPRGPNGGTSIAHSADHISRPRAKRSAGARTLRSRGAWLRPTDRAREGLLPLAYDAGSRHAEGRGGAAGLSAMHRCCTIQQGRRSVRPPLIGEVAMSSARAQRAVRTAAPGGRVPRLRCHRHRRPARPGLAGNSLYTRS